MHRSMRDAFTGTTAAALDEDPRIAVVLAEISADRLAAAARRHPDRGINVGIREQAMIGMAGGLALTGMRPVVHSITPFLVERPCEQLKLDLGHEGTGAPVVSTGASCDYPGAGRTHMTPGDVALPGWTVHVPGHPDEAAALVARGLRRDDPVYVRLSERENAEPPPVEGLHVLRRDPRVSFLVDDIASREPWRVRGVEIRGAARRRVDRGRAQRRRDPDPAAADPVLGAQRAGAHRPRRGVMAPR